MRNLFGIGLLLLSSLALAGNPKVKLETDMGTIVLEVFEDKAPITAQNFLDYVDSGFYDGTIFHRVIPNFVVQGGGFTFDFQRKETKAPIKNESDNGLLNNYGTLSMARLSDPNSATSQFFINVNVRGNPHLDPQKNKPGYAVFAKVVEGIDVVDAITREPRGNIRAFPEAPNVAIRILKARRL
ncbi:peptidylprolyl isomerase [Simiduia agarivorans]|uniref:Peptidyl-prolyl cis-trans isomerase n=1 Tax=Simiduia agarivorans (strain DSM 21679 / JCM 13881 / BCRC 17597 / SA1) TaxID=1117647 RepID=K4KHE5_SIMAS|nr:peptidylprolyl isomerase [Simiduia agarivorans]AFU97373.1 peptidyl-prolyl cis-trans isomerase A [Simiduia agarivorans SA1 = DSM 21679]